MFTNVHPSVVDVVVLIARLHRELDAQTLEDLDIHLGEHHGSVSLTALRAALSEAAVVERAMSTSSV